MSKACRDEGLLLLSTSVFETLRYVVSDGSPQVGLRGTVLTTFFSAWLLCRFIPPLVVTEAELDLGLAMFDRALRKVAAHMAVKF